MWVIMILIFFLCSGGFSAERVVLLELFTSSTCGPCFFANSYLDTTYSSEDEDVSLIRYHVWWPAPGNDPFYLANPYPNRARVNFYNIDAVPTLVVDGGVRDESYTAWGMIIEARRSLASPVELYAYMSEFGRARIKITANESFQTGSQRLFFVIVEDSIRYNAPNGQRIFHQVMREMFPNSTGKLVFVAAGETTGTELDYYIKPEWNEDNIHAVIFLQNEFSKEVYQSVKVSLPPRPEYAFYVNVPMSKAFVAAGDSVVLPFTVVNTGSSVDTYEVMVIERRGDGWNITLSDTSGVELDVIRRSGDNIAFNVKFVAPLSGGEGLAIIGVRAASGGDDYLFSMSALSDGELLFVDDTPRGESQFKYMLDSLGIVYSFWRTLTDGEPLNITTRYHAIIWDCGESRNFTLLQEQEQYLRNHLSARGSLVLTGSGLGAEIGDDAFYRIFIGANFIGTNSGLVEIYGSPDESLTRGISFSFDTRFAEYIASAPYNHCIFRYSGGECAGIRGGRSGFIYIPFNINEAQPESIRNEFITRLILWALSYTQVVTSNRFIPDFFGFTIFPTPFNSSLRIDIYLPHECYANLSVYDLLGHRIDTVYSGVIRGGKANINWKADNLSSGVYFILLDTPLGKQIKKSLLLK